MKVIFTSDPLYTRVKFLNAKADEINEALGLMRTVTQARPEGYQHMPAYKRGTWDGYIRLFQQSKFPTGLLRIVIDALPADAEYDVNHTPKPYVDESIVRPDMFAGITLRQYQVQAAVDLIRAGRGIAKMATNSGKTEVIAAICKAMTTIPILVLTTKRDLLAQTSDRLSLRLGEEVGRIGDSLYQPRRVTVGMIQTLCRLQSLPEVGCVMADECHHVPSKTAQQVMLDLPAFYRFGFSGTPLSRSRLDDLMLIAATGPVVIEVSNMDLVEAGISAKPLIEMYLVSQSDDNVYKDKWDQGYQKFIVDSQQRNHLIANLVGRYKAGSTLVLVERIEHGLKLESMICGSRFIHGSMSTEERQTALSTLRSANGSVIIATPIFDEGVDVPAVDLLVLAGGGKGEIKLLQRLGRGMRRKEGENILHVIDFVDDTNKHLLQHSYKRAQLYETEGFEVKVVEEDVSATSVAAGLQ